MSTLYSVELGLMKKILKDIIGFIFRHRREVLMWIVVVVVLQLFLVNWGVVMAAGDTFTEQVNDWFQTMSFAGKVVYVLLYPVLVIVWKLVDNSLVYWQVFGFDSILWDLRVMVRNIANFWLWFIFVYKIFEFLIKWQKWEDLKKLIVSALIAWVWIQASWFIMAALIDVSTILTYWIWWLPISVLWWDSNNWDKSEGDKGFNPYVMKNIITMDVDDPNSGIIMYLTNTDMSGNNNRIYISECKTMYKPINGTWNNKTWASEELIIAPRMIYYKNLDGKVLETKDNMCHYYWQIYYFNGFYDWDVEFKCNDTNKFEWKKVNKAWDYTWDQICYEEGLHLLL